jgi:hypothetical protein
MIKHAREFDFIERSEEPVERIDIGGKGESGDMVAADMKAAGDL